MKLTRRWPTRHFVPVMATALSALATGCESTSAESTSAGADTTTSEPAPDTSGGTTDSPGADTTGGGSACAARAPKATGYVQSSRGLLYYHNTPVTISAARDAVKGCTNSLTLGLSIDGGCALELNYSIYKTSWVLSSASFHGDAKCGEAWTDGEDTLFQADASTARTSLMGVAAPAADVDAACPTRQIRPIGTITLTAPGADAGNDRVMELGLNSLTIDGDVTVADGELSGCPVEARTCVGLSCGRDYFGADCGGCGSGLTCSSGTCVEGGCKPDSTNKIEGGPIGNQDYKDENGEVWSLHNQCGAPAVWMIKVAHWCSACTALAPSFQALYDEFAPLGVKFVLLVGQKNDGSPAQVADARSYKIKHGYQAGWIVVADPDWSLTESVVTSTSDYIPSHVILDQDLILRQASANSDSVWAEQTALLQILARQGLVK